jgi:hypothetical protein
MRRTARLLVDEQLSVNARGFADPNYVIMVFRRTYAISFAGIPDDEHVCGRAARAFDHSPSLEHSTLETREKPVTTPSFRWHMPAFAPD